MVRDILEQALASVRYNRRRSALTMLGMAWGIATVVLLLSYGAGFERAVWAAFSSFGSDLILVFPGHTSMEAGGTKAGTDIRLTQADVDTIATQVPLVKRITPMVSKDVTLQYENRTATAPVIGALPLYGSMHNADMEEGAYLTDEDEFAGRRVVVLGADIKKKLFSGLNAMDASVRIDGISFRVVGVLKYHLNDSDDNNNKQAFVPFSTMSDLKDTTYLSGIHLTYEGPENLKVAQNIRHVMAAHHGFKPDDRRAVNVVDMKDELKEIQIITAGIKILLTFIGILTLGIGGVGLMNIMLVAVTQRTREIGIEKALGARRRHILLQFLAEALAITFSGGLAGVMIAYVISWSVGSLTLWSAFYENASEGDIHLQINASILAISACILIAVGVVSGMWPAVKASRLDPIEALRYE